MKNVFRMPKKSRITLRSSYLDIGRFWGMAIPTIKRKVEMHRQQDSTAVQRYWSSFFQKYQCSESWNIEAMERQMYHSLQWRFYISRTLVPNGSLCQSAQCLHSSFELASCGPSEAWSQSRWIGSSGHEDRFCGTRPTARLTVW